MKWRLRLIGLSWSAHGQVFRGPGATPLGKIFWLVQPIVEPPFVIRVFQCGVSCRVSYIEKILQPHFVLYSSLKIVKPLQLHGHRQIAEPRKYCLVHVIVFFSLACVFSFFFFLFLTGWEFSLIPYNIQQSENERLFCPSPKVCQETCEIIVGVAQETIRSQNEDQAIQSSWLTQSPTCESLESNECNY